MMVNESGDGTPVMPWQDQKVLLPLAALERLTTGVMETIGTAVPLGRAQMIPKYPAPMEAERPANAASSPAPVPADRARTIPPLPPVLSPTPSVAPSVTPRPLSQISAPRTTERAANGAGYGNFSAGPVAFSPYEPQMVPVTNRQDDLTHALHAPVGSVREILVAGPTRGDARAVAQLMAEAISDCRNDQLPVSVGGAPQGVASGIVIHCASYRDVLQAEEERIDRLVLVVHPSLDSTFAARRLADHLMLRGSGLRMDCVIATEGGEAASLLSRQIDQMGEAVVRFTKSQLPTSTSLPPYLSPLRMGPALELAAAALSPSYIPYSTTSATKATV